MKLRVRGSTLRLRLTKPEVDALVTKGLVEEFAEFPANARLRYAVAVEGAKVSASFDSSGVVIRIPRAEADRWRDSDEVGIEGTDGPTRILVEKDWACVQPRSDEDPAVMYENPRLAPKLT